MIDVPQREFVGREGQGWQTPYDKHNDEWQATRK